jgi:hypothetical protein
MNSETQAIVSLGSVVPRFIQDGLSGGELQQIGDGLVKGGSAAAGDGGLKSLVNDVGAVEELAAVKDMSGELKDKTYDVIYADDVLPSLGEAVIDLHALSKKQSFENAVSSVIKSKTDTSPKDTKEGTKELIHGKLQGLLKPSRAPGSPRGQCNVSNGGKMSYAEALKSTIPTDHHANNFQTRSGTARPRKELDTMTPKYIKLRDQHRRKAQENNQLKNEIREKDEKLEVVKGNLANARNNNRDLRRQLHNFNHDMQLTSAATTSQKEKAQIKNFQKCVLSALEKTKDQNTLFSKCNEELASVKKNPSQDLEIAALKRKDKHHRAKIAKLIERIRNLEQGLAAAQAFPATIGLTSRPGA